MPLKIHAKDAEGKVETEHKVSGETIDKEETDHKIGQVKVVGDPAIVHMTMGVTKNLGNFESFKVSVSLSMPCAADLEEIDQTAKTIEGWIDNKITAVIADAMDEG